MYGKIRKIHFIGIGGIGMSGIAEVLLNLNYQISGSDLRASDITQRLGTMGAEIYLGHAASNLRDVDVVVTSSAVKSDNAEVSEALRRLIPVIPRAEMLAELMRMKYGIAVAGTHGKTTTTSMVATLFCHGGLDPTAVIGGRLDAFGSNAKLGQGQFLVAEADESDGSFLKLSPTIAIVTNIDADHLDFYRDLEEIKETFVEFINKIPFYGRAILCLDDKNIQGIIPLIRKRFTTYGFSAQADFQASEVEHQALQTSFAVDYCGQRLGRISFQMPGDHNVLNALAATAAAMEVGLDFATIAAGFKNFGGVQRRFQIKDEINGIMIVDDYGHHPAEIKATLNAARNGWERRIVTVFQPHRYSRTAALFDDFTTAFYETDQLIILDIYAAGEDAIDGISAEKLAAQVTGHGHKDVQYLADRGKVVDHLLSNCHEGDIVITMGAGNVWQIGEEFAQRLHSVVAQQESI
jgi:UDP-N-acetylmuramate--alanine ligase